MSADNLLTSLDESFSRAQQGARRPRDVDGPAGAPAEDARSYAYAVDEEDEATPPMTREDWVLLGFLVVQFLWGVVLFIPGTQGVRPYLRALPYLTSGALLPLYLLHNAHHRRPAGAGLLVSALMLLVLNLLHPTSQLAPGLAQCLFQFCIAAPIFWAHKLVESSGQMRRMLTWVLAMNLASAVVGILQVYYPDTFLPSQFSTALRDDYLTSLTYVGRAGRSIVRPPGLSDLPGAASIAGGTSAVLAFALMLTARGPRQQTLLSMAAVVGLAVIYLTQVRSVLLVSLGAVSVVGLVAVRYRRMRNALWIVGAGGMAIVGSFLWASALGGSNMGDRFIGIGEQGALRVYQESRGNFLAYTVGELLDEYPLGAGVGRWGMMNQYFADANEYRSAPIHVEIQPTGWLLDGGLPMWFLYGGALLASILASIRSAGSRNERMFGDAAAVLGVQLMVAGMGMASPAFNTQLGILFWLLGSGLHGAATEDRGAAER